MERSAIIVGQVYWIKHRKVGSKLVRVTKINPKNVKAVSETGTPWNVHPSFLFETTAAEAASFGSGTTPPAMATPIPYVPSKVLYYGNVVRFTNGRHEGLYTVIGQTNDKYRVARLGGDNGRYIRNVDSSNVEVVTFDLAGV